MEVMKPLSEVHNCDCMEFMRSLPDKFFDLSIADPPYGINATQMKIGETKGYESTANRLRKGRLNSGAGKLKNRALNQMNCDWDFEPPSQEFFDELERVSKNRIIWGGNYFNLPPTRCIVCWDKEQPWENFSQVELAWTSFDKPAKLFRMGSRGGNNIEERIHPTQKIDPMMGSQSSRVAAYKMGFDYCGCELDTEYFKKGCERFERICLAETKLPSGKIVKQLSLFE